MTGPLLKTSSFHNQDRSLKKSHFRRYRQNVDMPPLKLEACGAGMHAALIEAARNA
jgi:hypothetical protein